MKLIQIKIKEQFIKIYNVIYQNNLEIKKLNIYIEIFCLYFYSISSIQIFFSLLQKNYLLLIQKLLLEVHLDLVFFRFRGWLSLIQPLHKTHQPHWFPPWQKSQKMEFQIIWLTLHLPPQSLTYQRHQSYFLNLVEIITNKQFTDIFAGMLLNLIHPISDVVECFLVIH